MESGYSIRKKEKGDVVAVGYELCTQYNASNARPSPDTTSTMDRQRQPLIFVLAERRGRVLNKIASQSRM